MSVVRLVATRACLFAVTVGFPLAARAQYPMSPTASTGQAVSPVYEGWYKNRDGTISLSFGYFNRNTEEIIDIPVGPNNFVSPGVADQGQPTRFHARRHWGVFAVKVPADFGRKTLTWTLKIRGETYAIPAHLKTDWQIDAIDGEGGTGNTPPALRFAENGPDVRGPGGALHGPLQAKVGQPITLTIWARDSAGTTTPAARGATTATTTLTWFVHQGAGAVVFGTPSARVVAAAPTAPAGAGGRGGAALPPLSVGSASTTATFSAAGTYVLRVRANDASGVDNAGHAQCCWTNAFVKVVVTQ